MSSTLALRRLFLLALSPLTLTLTLGASVPRASTPPTYTLSDDYSTGAAFFSGFSFFSDADPTQGHVKFLDQGAAFSSNLAGLNVHANNSIYLGVDTQHVTPDGRPALRVASKKTYGAGSLIVADLQHMPGGICGVWPAFWLLGPNWPAGGEIDVIEGVNDATTNAMTLHTGAGCRMTPQNASAGYTGPKYAGTLQTADCDVNDPAQPKNAGCGIVYGGAGSPFGAAFNRIGGGVYAVEWTSAAISIWHFPRGSLPADIHAASPNPRAWPEPAAAFASTSCDFGKSFQPQQLVFDTTFCGAWAGAVWDSSPTCKAKAATCADYVSNNPQAFVEAYWQINSLKVYAGK